MSQRHKIDNNPNDCKNTRLSPADIAKADSRTDILAHLSRYQKIAEMMIKESKELGRPLDILEVGCGEIWPLRLLYKAYICRKSDVVSSYLGLDIDDKMLEDVIKEHSGILDIMNGQVVVQDVTVNPVFDLPDESINFFYSTEVIEHMAREFVPAWLDDAHRCLRPGGLIYISTPNHDGSNAKLPVDHVYEWGYQELKEELESRWKLIEHTGTFIQMRHFNRENAQHKFFPEYLVSRMKERFDSYWLRNVLAAPYPWAANNVAWILRKEK